MNIKNIKILLKSINESKENKINTLIKILNQLDEQIEKNVHITKLQLKNENVVCEGYTWEGRSKETFEFTLEKNHNLMRIENEN